MANNKEIQLTISIKGDKLLVKSTKDAKALNKEIEKTTKTGGRAAAVQDKLLKGTAGSKNATTDFAKQAQGLGGVVRIYATIAANVWALTAAFDVLKKSADVSIMARSAAQLSKSTGISYGAVAESMQQITGGAISFTDAMRQANLGLSGGASFSQLEGVTEIATKAANALGLSVPNAVGRMIQAVTKGEPELVDELGIILRVTKATEEYAAEIGTTAEKLTTFQKQQAILNQLLTQGEQKFGAASIEVNPFAALGASLADVSKEVLEFVTGPLGTVASFIKDNTLLMITGFAFLAKSLAGLVIPLILQTAEASGTLATESSTAATEAAKDYETLTASIRETGNALDKTLAQQKKLRQSKTPGTFFSSLTEKEGSTIFENLDKTSGPGRKIKEIINKGISQGLSKDEIFKTVQKSGVLKSIGEAIERGDKSILNRAGRKMSKTIFGAMKDDLDEINAFGSASGNVDKNQAEQEIAKIKKKELALIKLSAAREKTFRVANNELLQNKKLGVTYELLTSAINKVNASYRRGIQPVNLWGKAQQNAAKASKFMKLGVSALVPIVGKVINGIFGLVATIGLLFAGLKSIVGAMGLTTKGFGEVVSTVSKATEKISGFDEEFGGLALTMSQSTDTLEEGAAKWAKIGNILGTVTNQVDKLIDAFKVASEATFWDKLLSANFAIADETVVGIQEGIAQAKKLSVDPANFKPTIAIPEFKPADQKKIEDLLAKIQRFEDSKGKQKGNEAKIRRDIIGFEKEIAAIEQIGEKIEELDLINAKTFAAQHDRLTKSGLDADKVLKKSVQAANAPSDSVVLAAALAATALQQVDRQITDMANKSESRRIFTIDSSINIRDRIKDLENAATTMDKFGKSRQSIVAFFEGANKSFKDAFFSSVKEGATGPEILSALIKVRKEMDLDIDTIRNLSKNLKLLGVQASQLKDEQKRGDLTTFQKLSDNQTNSLTKQIEAKHSELRQIKQQIVQFGSKDEAEKILSEKLLVVELARLEEKLRLTKDTIPPIQKQLAEIKRIEQVEKARNKLLKETASLYKNTSTINSQFSATIGLQTVILEDQLKLSKRTERSNLSDLDTAKEKLNAQAELKEESESFINQQELAYQLSLLDVKAQNIKTKALQEQLKLTKDIFNTNNLARGQIGDTGFANSFSGFFDNDFWTDTSTKFGIIANDMALKIGNSVDNMSNIIVGGIENVNSTIVDAMLSRTWDGKEEGESFGHALRESLKATLRASIGESIKDNMTQAVVKMLGSTDTMVTSMATQVSALQLNTQAISQMRIAFMASTPGSNYSDAFKTLYVSGSGGVSPTLGDVAGTPFAHGGVVERPTNALIGEGGLNEAVVPLPDNRSIPVKLEGNTGSTVSVSQTFDFRGADPSSEARLRQYAQQIKQETTKEIFDSINRGGNAAKTVRRR